MTKDEIFEKAKAVIAEHLDVAAESVHRGADLVEDLNADSLDFVELTIALEEAFDIRLDDADVENVKTVGDATDLIEKRLSQAPAAA